MFRRTSNLAISYRRVFSPRIVNELTFGFARFGFTRAKLTLPGRTIRPMIFKPSGRLHQHPLRALRISPQILDNLSFVQGSHVFRTGINFRFYRHVDQRGQPGGINVTPSITFSGTTRRRFAPELALG